MSQDNRTPLGPDVLKMDADTIIEHACARIEPDDVTVTQPGNRAKCRPFGRQMDRRGHLARRAGHAPVGDDGDALTC